MLLDHGVAVVSLHLGLELLHLLLHREVTALSCLVNLNRIAKLFSDTEERREL